MYYFLTIEYCFLAENSEHGILFCNSQSWPRSICIGHKYSLLINKKHLSVTKFVIEFCIYKNKCVYTYKFDKFISFTKGGVKNQIHLSHLKSYIFIYGTIMAMIDGSWMYDYLCNQCISPLTLWVPIPLKCTRYNIMW
jgi:hypothetical protein